MIPCKACGQLFDKQRSNKYHCDREVCRRDRKQQWDQTKGGNAEAKHRRTKTQQKWAAIKDLRASQPGMNNIQIAERLGDGMTANYVAYVISKCGLTRFHPSRLSTQRGPNWPWK